MRCYKQLFSLTLSLLLSWTTPSAAAQKALQLEDHITLLQSYTTYSAKAAKCKLSPELKMTKERFDSKLAYLKRVSRDVELEVAMELLYERTDKTFEATPASCQQVKKFINTYMSARD